MGLLVDLKGQRFGRLTVGERTTSVSGNARWIVKCDCGSAEKVVLANDLRRGKVLSCGCLRDEKLRDRRTSHGMSDHPAYGSWRAMISRCSNPDDVSYPLYGGRGITVCDRWSDFDNFWRDMSPKWRPRLSLDRIDVNGNYEPRNCRWATAKQQGRNRRDNRIIDTPSGPLTVVEASEKYGVPYNTIIARLRYGWTDPGEVVKPVMDKTQYLKQYKSKAP